MLRGGRAVLAAAMMAATGTPAAAQVLDATYRGTMVCDKLPFKPFLSRVKQGATDGRSEHVPQRPARA